MHAEVIAPDRQPTVTGTEPRKRLAAFDLIRVISACGVIWFHMEGAPFKAYRVGFISFVILAVILHTFGAVKYSFFSFVRKRAVRILIPWAFWFLFYAALNVLKGKVMFPYSSGWLENLLAGPWIGLWFLPFILLVAFLIYGLARALKDLAPALISGILAAMGVFSFWWIFSSAIPQRYDAPWAQWIYAAPAVLIGLAYSRLFHVGSAWRWALCVSIPVSTFAVSWLSLDFSNGSWPYAIGTLLVSLALLVRLESRPWISQAGELCMGVYLIHSVYLTTFKFLFGSHYLFAPQFILTVLFSFLSVYLLRKNHWCRWVL